MKRVLACILALLMAFSLTACGSTPTADSKNENVNTEVETSDNNVNNDTGTDVTKTGTDEFGSIVLSWDELGQYGETIVLNKNTDNEYSYIAFHIPAGKYVVKNNNTSGASQISIYENGVNVNDDGIEEPIVSEDVRPVVVFAGESAEITISDSQYVKLADGDTSIEFIKDTSVAATAETVHEETEKTVDQTVVIDGNTITLKDDGTGTASSENGMEKTPVLTTRDINYEVDSGSVHMVIESLQISKIKATSSDMASMLDLEVDTDSVLIAIQATIENTSDEDVSFYPYMSTIITNTKSQVESNWMFSDDVGGDFMGNVQKSGQIYWIIPDANADEITHLQWRIDAPIDSEFEKLGDDLKIEIELSK